jgi:pyrimidine operon attenuation protein/uracil phosphoribosyltransferase
LEQIPEEEGVLMVNIEKAHIMNEDDMKRVLRRIAIEIIERNRGLEDVILLGIQRRGVYLAGRLRELLKDIEGVKVPTGELDITLYRDDIPTLLEQPVVHSTSIPGDIAGKKLVLVDDVLYTGRTIRSALDALMDLGRPDSVQLVILVDRGHRELPIQADYVGKVIPTSRNEMVEVMVKELDGQDRVVITEESEVQGD